MTPKPKAPDDLALDRFLADKSTAEEAAAVRAWLDASGRDEGVLEAVRRAASYDAESFRTNTETSLAQAHRRIEAEHQARTAARFRASRWVPILAAAAVVVVIAGSVISSYTSRVGEMAATPFQTSRGERRTFALTDGSLMILAPQSRVRFVDGRRERRVELDGEAFFRVKHEGSRPFTVVARNATATDIGTEFVVRSYPGDPSVDIAVADGVVAVSSENRRNTSTILQKGEVARVDASGSTSVRHDLDASAYTGWTTGRLIFRDATLASITADLSRWFNADIAVGDDRLAQQRLSAVYDKPTLDGVLAALAATTGARIERSGNTVRLVRDKSP
jgi:transmembrane sensor